MNKTSSTYYLKKTAESPREESLPETTLVQEIIQRVRTDGESAVRHYMNKFDKWSPMSFRIPREELATTEKDLPADLVSDIQFLNRQVERFARAQRDKLVDFEVETLPGVHIGQRHLPINSVGVYVPGGRYTLIASAQMSIVPAKVAGVKRIVACAPPKNGRFNPAVLYSIYLAGADEVYSLGGAQAIAAMAFGMGDLKPVDMIAGPGNKYVVEAKRQLFGIVGIDFIAGPTEILIIADKTADPEILAADLVGQAEHDVDSKAVLISTSRDVAAATIREVEKQLNDLPTAQVARTSWEKNGQVILVENHADAVSLANDFAPEHLQVQTEDPEWFLPRLNNYGTLFLGEFTTTTYSDKAIGPNHILPTGKAARYTGGLWVGKFLKTVTYQRLEQKGGEKVVPVAARISRAEGMTGHAISAEIRAKKYGYTVNEPSSHRQRK